MNHRWYKTYLLLGQLYNKLENKYCHGTVMEGNYSSVQDAKAACSLDSNCEGVYDDGCDESLNDVYLCSFESKIRFGYDLLTGKYSCVYGKTGIAYY